MVRMLSAPKTLEAADRDSASQRKMALSFHRSFRRRADGLLVPGMNAQLRWSLAKAWARKSGETLCRGVSSFSPREFTPHARGRSGWVGWRRLPTSAALPGLGQRSRRHVRKAGISRQPEGNSRAEIPAWTALPQTGMVKPADLPGLSQRCDGQLWFNCRLASTEGMTRMALLAASMAGPSLAGATQACAVWYSWKFFETDTIDDVRNGYGRKTLQSAVTLPGIMNLAGAEVLTAAGAGADARNESGWKPLDPEAGFGESTALIEVPLDGAADPKSPTAEGGLPVGFCQRE